MRRVFTKPVITGLLLALLLGAGSAAGQDPAPQEMVSSKIRIGFEESDDRVTNADVWQEHFSHYALYLCDAPIRADLNEEGNVQCTGTFSTVIHLDNDRIDEVDGTEDCALCTRRYVTDFQRPKNVTALYGRMGAVDFEGRAANPLSQQVQWEAATVPIAAGLASPNTFHIFAPRGPVTIIVNVGGQ